MRTWKTIPAFCAALFASSADGAPCVGAAFDTPLPGATDVVTYQRDVPTPQFPGVWQEGRTEGFSYRLFANRDGVLLSDERNEPEWRIGFTCANAEERCTSNISGTPPTEATAVAEKLQRCLLGEPLSPPEIAEPEVEVVVEEGIEPTPPEPCGKALVSAASDEALLQELLTMAGADPGPIDGLIGPQTRDALSGLTNANLEEIGLSEAIATLDELVCSRLN